MIRRFIIAVAILAGLALSVGGLLTWLLAGDIALLCFAIGAVLGLSAGAALAGLAIDLPIEVVEGEHD